MKGEKGKGEVRNDNVRASFPLPLFPLTLFPLMSLIYPCLNFLRSDSGRELRDWEFLEHLPENNLAAVRILPHDAKDDERIRPAINNRAHDVRTVNERGN